MLLESAVTIDALEVRDAAGKSQPEHQLVHRRLCEYAKQRSALDAAEAFDLVRAEQLRLYALHGCISHYDYMERELAWGPHAARERMRVARALVTLPNTAAALARGERTYTAVRELTRVAAPETETAWLTATAGMIAPQIEQLVAGHKYGDHPDDPTEPMLRPRMLRLELPPEMFALWRQARLALGQERGGEVSDPELVEAMCRRILDPGTGTKSPAHQIALKQCNDCRRITQNGAGREIDVGPEVLDRAACDASLIGSLDAPSPARTTTSVTPRLRQQVFARDNFRCTVPGCRSAQNLEVHHLHEQGRGGTHELSNLTLLCSGHHQALHAGQLSMRGEAPHAIQFRWTYGPPLPPGLSPETREAMIKARVRDVLGIPPESIDTTIDDLIHGPRRARRVREEEHTASRGTSGSDTAPASPDRDDVPRDTRPTTGKIGHDG